MRGMKNIYKSNTFLAVVSIIIAVVIWIYVVYEVNPMYETWIEDIPVECINTSELFDDGSLVITGNNSELLNSGLSIDVRIRGKRNTVSSAKKANFTCSLDMFTVSRDGTFNLKPNIETDISGLEILKSSPNNFKIKVENIEQRDIDLTVKTTGELPSGYTIEDVQNNNKSVKVTGAPSVIGKIKKAEVELNYDELDVNTSEKVCKIHFYDADGVEIDSSDFKKTIEYAKLSYSVYTEKEVNLILMPKYKNEVNVNNLGKTVKLTLEGSGTATKDGGLEMKLRLRGIASALQKYEDGKKIVYTEDIDISQIYADTVLKEIKAAELSNSVSYVNAPVVSVKATLKEN